jgi:hypothetical protein
LSIDKQLTITLNNLNEAPINILIDKSNLDENSENNTVVGVLSTTDLDGVDTHSYTLINNAGDRFQLIRN